MMNTHTATRFWFVASIVLIGSAPLSANTAPYDPLAVDEGFNPRTIDTVVHDDARDRDIPVLIYLPEDATPAPVVLFSHGLGGSRLNNTYLGRHWSARGYVAVFVQHPGSDADVWRDAPPRQRMAALKRAASGANYLHRVKDIPAVLDRLETWHASNDHALAGRLNTDKVGMSGHSFGAVTTQGVSGQTTPRGQAIYTDTRIDAATLFSPSTPNRGTPEQAFGRVKIPWLLMTGTKDGSPVNDTSPEDRMGVYPALPPGDKYEVVLHDAEHSAFSGRALPGDATPRNPNHHRVILALSAAFWDAYLRDDAAALEWLTGQGPRSIMETEDRWQKK
ncbi:MAG: alpha/beta hydrolase family protein [Planctomycetota bacterium]|jgi:predicted dienelactone hydrolase